LREGFLSEKSVVVVVVFCLFILFVTKDLYLNQKGRVGLKIILTVI